jgi:hypothetical protein
MGGPTATADRRAAIHLIVQAALAALLAAASYMAFPWSAAFAEVFLRVRGGLMPAEMPPALFNLAAPVLILLMVVNQAIAIPAVARSRLAGSRRFLVGGSLLLAVIGVMSFPGASHDLELYHAHARMSVHGINPYQTTPQQALGESLSETMPWPDQHAPYGPLAIGMHSLLIGTVTDPWVAAMLLKALYALIGVIFVGIILRAPGIGDAGKAAGAITVGWSPLLMLEFAGNGHSDSLMGALCALAILVFLQGRVIQPWLLLGAAALVKIEALLFLPILVAARGQGGSGLARKIALPGIPIVLGLAGYLFFGGPQNALPGLREEASKVMRSVPQLAAYASGAPAGQTAWVLRAIFVAAFAGIAWSVVRGRSILVAAPLLYGTYLILAKSFLQPWHGALLVFLLAAARIGGLRARLLEWIVATWSVSAVLGGYSYLIATRNFSAAGQAASTLIMVVPVLVAAAVYGLARATRGRRALPAA